MNEFTMTIDGQAAAREQFFPVINPATGEAFADAPEASQDQLDAAMDAARRAFPAWQKDENARRQALLDCAVVLRAHTDMLADVLTREQGRPLPGARDEVGLAARDLEAFARMGIPC